MAYAAYWKWVISGHGRLSASVFRGQNRFWSGLREGFPFHRRNFNFSKLGIKIFDSQPSSAYTVQNVNKFHGPLKGPHLVGYPYKGTVRIFKKNCLRVELGWNWKGLWPELDHDSARTHQFWLQAWPHTISVQKEKKMLLQARALKNIGNPDTLNQDSGPIFFLPGSGTRIQSHWANWLRIRNKVLLL